MKEKLLMGLFGALILFLGAVGHSPAVAQESQGLGGLTEEAAPLDEATFLIVTYCGKVAGLIWFGPDSMPGLVRVEQLRDPRVRKLVVKAYVAAKKAGNVYVQDTGRLTGKCPVI